MSVRESVDAAFTKLCSCVDDGLPVAAFRELIVSLASSRDGATSGEWRDAVFSARGHAAHARLREDPFVASAVSMPRGYPADAPTLDFVYRCRALDPMTSAVGRALHSVSTSGPIADAMRARRDWVADKIGQQLADASRSVIVSLACGHMRELHAVDRTLLVGARIVAADQDCLALESLAAFHPALPIETLVVDLARVIRHPDTLPPAHLLYAATLFDHVEDRVARSLVRSLARALRPGGTLLIPSLSPRMRDIASVEAIMDWWLCYRDREATTHLGHLACMNAPDLTFEVEELDGELVTCLIIRRDEVQNSTEVPADTIHPVNPPA